MSTTAAVNVLGKRPTNVPPADVGAKGQRRKLNLLDDIDTTNDEPGPSSVIATPMPPPHVDILPMFDLSDWVSAFYTQTWTKGNPAPSIDQPMKVLLPRGNPKSKNSPFTAAAKTIADKTNLMKAGSSTTQKYDLNPSEFNGLLVLDCDNTILHVDKEKRCHTRLGLHRLFSMCQQDKIKICLMSTASKEALDAYRKMLEHSCHVKIDLQFSAADHAGGIPKFCIDGSTFKIKVLSHFFTEATLKRTVFVDDMLAQVCLQPENSFLVTEFYTDVLKQDHQLVHLTSVLCDIFSRPDDLRPVIAAKNGMMPLIDAITKSIRI